MSSSSASVFVIYFAASSLKFAARAPLLFTTSYMVDYRGAGERLQQNGLAAGKRLVMRGLRGPWWVVKHGGGRAEQLPRKPVLRDCGLDVSRDRGLYQLPRPRLLARSLANFLRCRC